MNEEEKAENLTFDFYIYRNNAGDIVMTNTQDDEEIGNGSFCRITDEMIDLVVKRLQSMKR